MRVLNINQHLFFITQWRTRKASAKINFYKRKNKERIGLNLSLSFAGLFFSGTSKKDLAFFIFWQIEKKDVSLQ
jgi:hypothetical protein